MTSKKYEFILADDHKGNKALVVIKGKLSMELATQAKVVDDDRFKDVAQQLKHIIDSSSVINKGGDKQCN